MQTEMWNKPLRVRRRSTEEKLSPEQWLDRYDELVGNLISEMAVGESFTGERLRQHCRGHGLPEPRHPNVWSACARKFIRRWRADDRIDVGGIAPAEDPRSRACIMPRYVKVRG